MMCASGPVEAFLLISLSLKLAVLSLRDLSVCGVTATTSEVTSTLRRRPWTTQMGGLASCLPVTLASFPHILGTLCSGPPLQPGLQLFSLLSLPTGHSLPSRS